MSDILAVDARGPSVLKAPLFVVEPDGPERPLSLAVLVARLLVGPKVYRFSHLAAEQRGYWWRFLVRCAARALRSLGIEVQEASSQPLDPLASEIEGALTAASLPEAWELFQPDATLPGFLQPPTPD